MKITATIQARMGSSRLPGKVLSNIIDKPMLLIQIERIRRSRLVDNVIVATTNSKADDKIEEFCIKNNVDYFRGPEDDVLSRLTSCIRDFNVDIHVEMFGDSPLVDPQIIDEFLGVYLKFSDKYDYISSALKTTYPPGLEVSVYKSSVLIETNKLVLTNDPLREHCGFNITRFKDKFNILSVEAPKWLHYPDVYLEVDYPEDLELIREIVTYFDRKNLSYFSTADILSLLKEQPELFRRNNSIKRRWKSLRKD